MRGRTDGRGQQCFLYVCCTYKRMSGSDPAEPDPELERINLRLSRSFLERVDQTWRERGFNSRSEFIRHAMRDAVNHPEGTGFWRDLAISEAQLDDGAGKTSDEVKAEHGLDGE